MSAAGAADPGPPERIVQWIRSKAPPHAQLRLDSRAIEPGDVFVAVPGRRSDGRAHAADAIARGAAAIVAEVGAVDSGSGGSSVGSDAGWLAAAVPVLPVAGLSAQLGGIGATYYGDPTARLTTIGVTGTNGKTSCSHWIAQLLTACGRKCAVIGTVGSGFVPLQQDASSLPMLTTPDALNLQAQARRFLDQGARALAMEVSSIGLDQGRVDGIRFEHALFTNLTRDHLDYHASMQDYERAKAALFDRPTLSHAVLNLDDECGRRLAQRCASRGIRTTGYGIDAAPASSGAGLQCEIRGGSIQLGARGIRFEARLREPGGATRTVPVSAPVMGRFNVSNVLGVLGLALAAGVDAQAAADALQDLRAPPGRLQRIGVKRGDEPGEASGDRSAPLVLVDYAHTPDAIAKALDALRPVAQARSGRLWIVFGAGGDRDPGKRPQLGAAAVRGADRVVVTSDNPRGEDPEQIIDQIVRGVGMQGAADPAAPLLRIADRVEAIGRVLREAADADVVLLAGKGHETYQEIAGRRLPFSDADCARRGLQLRARRAPPDVSPP